MLNAEPLSYHIGHDGFIWFVGVVESTDDPLSIGRVKARIIGWHTTALSTNDLPWCYPIQPITDHTATHNLVPGDWIFGFFLDGKLGQMPMLLWGSSCHSTICDFRSNVMGAFQDSRTSAELLLAPRGPASLSTVNFSSLKLNLGGTPLPGTISGPSQISGPVRTQLGASIANKSAIGLLATSISTVLAGFGATGRCSEWHLCGA